MPTFRADYFYNTGDHAPAHTTDIPASSFERACTLARRDMGEFQVVRVSRSFLADHADTNLQQEHQSDDEETETVL